MLDKFIFIVLIAVFQTNTYASFLQIYDCEMAMAQVHYCGISLWSNSTGETVHNSLCIEFHSDDRTEFSSDDYLGFVITYYQRKGIVNAEERR